MDFFMDTSNAVEVHAVFKTQRTISDSDLASALRLKEIWQKRKSELRLTQMTASELLGFSQAAFWQYLNGRLALNIETILKFSYLLKIDPREVDPNFPEWALPKHVAYELPNDAVSLLRTYSNLSEHEKKLARTLVEAVFSNR
jgi:transcriptional regulator with XRE-family HTH domain